jgi:hypothetical protein
MKYSIKTEWATAFELPESARKYQVIVLTCKASEMFLKTVKFEAVYKSGLTRDNQAGIFELNCFYRM